MTRFKQLLLIMLVTTISHAMAQPVTKLSCPSAHDLYIDPQTSLWKTKDGKWKSFTTSFSLHANQFLGAQWQGVNVGNIFCRYKGDTLTFPIILQYYQLVKEPIDNNWGKNLGGYRNCHSSDINDCLFEPVPKPHPSDTFQELKSLKSTPKMLPGF